MMPVVGVHLADHSVAFVGDEEIVGRSTAIRPVVQLGGGGRPAVAAVARRAPVARDGGDVRVEAATSRMRLLVVIGDKKIAGVVDRDAVRATAAPVEPASGSHAPWPSGPWPTSAATLLVAVPLSVTTIAPV